MIVKNMLNAVPSLGEVNTLPSLTIPDQSMSMREILARFVRGMPIEGGRTTWYDEDNDMPDLQSLDLSEVEDMRDNYRERIKKYKKSKKDERFNQETKDVPGEQQSEDAAPGEPGQSV